MLPNFRRVCSGLDVRALLSQLEANPLLFSAVTGRQDYPGSAHHDTDSVFIRWAKTQTVEAAFTEIPAVTYDQFAMFLPAYHDLYKELTQQVETKQLGRILITRLKPHGFIDPHVDEGPYADYYERFHIVLKSSVGNTFFIGDENGYGEFARMAPGEIWWFNHKKRHWFNNPTDEERIHLVIDAVAPTYRRERDEVPAGSI